MNTSASGRKGNFYIRTIQSSSPKPVMYVHISILAHLFLRLLHHTFNPVFKPCQVKVTST